jgi:hypothetical protein
MPVGEAGLGHRWLFLLKAANYTTLIVRSCVADCVSNCCSASAAPRNLLGTSLI